MKKHITPIILIALAVILVGCGSGMGNMQTMKGCPYGIKPNNHKVDAP